MQRIQNAWTLLVLGTKDFRGSRQDTALLVTNSKKNWVQDTYKCT